MRGWVVGGLAIALGLAFHAPAAAQTRAELVEWLFRVEGSNVSYDEPDNPPYRPNPAFYTAVTEKECVITLQVKGRAGDKNCRDTSIMIDFNKMIGTTLTIHPGEYASVAGQPGFVFVKTVRRDTGAPL